MSNITSCDSGSFSTENTRGDAVIKQKLEEVVGHQFNSPNSLTSTTTNSNGSNANSQVPPPPLRKKRSLPGNPDPSAEVVALSPNTLMTRNRFVCEICNKGFQRDQNLQLHRRGHNLPWKLKQRTSTEPRKKVYVCPEPSCVHHNPVRALGDLTGIKKHFSRKHGEKKWKCDKCSKRYAVQSDWKAHSKICGTREYKCDCGTIFSRRDSFVTHRAFCDALAEENTRANNNEQLPKILGSNSNLLQGHQQIANLVSSLPLNTTNLITPQIGTSQFNHSDIKQYPLSSVSLPHHHQDLMDMPPKPLDYMAGNLFSRSLSSNSNSMNVLEMEKDQQSAHMSATALLQKAAQMGATMSNTNSCMAPPSFGHDQYDISSYGMNVMGNVSNGVGNGMNSVEMFNAILDQSKALSRMIQQNSRSSNVSISGNYNDNDGGLRGGGGSSNKGSEDVMTVDFLGIGGAAGGGAHDAFLWRSTA